MRIAHRTIAKPFKSCLVDHAAQQEPANPIRPSNQAFCIDVRNSHQNESGDMSVCGRRICEIEWKREMLGRRFPMKYAHGIPLIMARH